MWTIKTKNGKVQFIERYTDYMTNKEKYVSVVLEKDTKKYWKLAKDILDEKIRNKSKRKDAKDYTLNDLCEAYMSYQKENVKATSYSRDGYAKNNILNMLGKDTLLSRLNAPYLINSFTDEHNKLLTDKDNIWRNTQRKYLLAMLRWGYDAEMITDISYLTKFKKFPEPTTQKERTEYKYMESNELKRVLKEMNKPNTKHWYLVTKFLAETGLRIGELCGLQKRDVDIKNRYIHITKTFNINDRTMSDSPKTADSYRSVYIQDDLVSTIKEITLYTRKQQLAFGYGATDIFFPGKDGDYIHYDAFRKYFKNTTDYVLDKTLTPHALRHTHVSILAEQGIDLDAISRRLGHSDSKVTKEVYFHVTKKLQERDNQSLKEIKIT